MLKNAHVPVCFLMSIAHVHAVHARGLVPHEWQIEPNTAIAACEDGTVPASFAHLCSDLLFAYSRELLKCPVEAKEGASQPAISACASSAARTAAAAIK
jgi:hypothetical protein